MAGEAPQIDYDRKGPLSLQLERLNQILLRIFKRIDKVEADVSATPSSGGGGTDDHAALTHLSYATAGHTGFSPTTHVHAESDVTDLTTDLAAKAPSARLISTTAPLTGGGDLSSDRTLAIPKATAAVDGYLDKDDWTKFNNKAPSGAWTVLSIVSGHISTDASLGTTFYIEADSDFILDTPTNIPSSGWRGIWIIKQISGGSHLITLSGDYRGGVEISVGDVVLSTVTGMVDYLECSYFGISGKLDILDFKTGYQETVDAYKVPITIPAASVGSSLLGFKVYVDLSDLPAAFWSHLIDPWGADIRVINSSGTHIPFDVVWINSVDQTGAMFVRTDLSDSSDTVIYVVYGEIGTEHLPFTDPNGRNAVWSDFHRVFMFGDYLYDRTGSGKYLTFPSTYNDPLSQAVLSGDIACHQGCAYDGTYYYTIGTNTLKKYNAAFAQQAINSDPCGDAGGVVTHCGGGFVRDGILYVPQTTNAYTVTQLSEYRTTDLSFIQTRALTAPGGVYWTAGVTYVPEWDQFVFCDYAGDGTKFFKHDNDATLTYAGAITLASALTTLQGICWWRGAFWVNRETDNYTYRVNQDGTEIKRMFRQVSYPLHEGISEYADSLYCIASNSASPEHGVVIRLDLQTQYGIAPGILFPDVATPTSYRATIDATRYTQWSIGVSAVVSLKTTDQAIVGYGKKTGTDNAIRETLHTDNANNKVVLWNDTDGFLISDPQTFTPSCAYKSDFYSETVGNAPSGWTERWTVASGTVTIRADGVIGKNSLEVVRAGSSKYGASIDAIGTSEDDCEVLALVEITTNNNFYTRIYARGSGAAASESAYFSHLNVGDDLIGLHKYVAGVSTNIQTAAKTINTGTWYYMRFRIVGTALKLKVWEKGASEPAAWDIEATDADLATGWVGIGGSSSTAAETNYDYIAVSVGASPITVPLPVDDIGVYRRLHVVHDGSTSRTLYCNGNATIDAGCTEKPTALADGLLLGYNDADLDYGSDGVNIEFLYLYPGILSADWISAEVSNLGDPASFYVIGAESPF
jgi:hypothetical protein